MDEHQASDDTALQVNNQNEWPIQLTNIQCTNLQYLNDDCLRQIFSLKSLTFMDLCSIAETCVRFREITRSVIRKELQINLFNYEVKRLNFAKDTQTPRELRRIFRSFGCVLSEVSILGRRFNEETFLFNLMRIYCSVTLERLKLFGLKFSVHLAVKLKPMFKRLQLLHLHQVNVESYTQLFADCDSLIDLKVVAVQNCNAILHQSFPKLKRFSYAKTRIVMAGSGVNLFDEQTVETLSAFISRHTTLDTLDFCIGFCDERCTMNLVEAIGRSCAKLNEFRMKIMGGTTTVPLRPLQQAFKSLRTLHLFNESLPSIDFFMPLTELRELRLHRWDIPKDFHRFASFIQLTKLELDGHESLDVVGIVSELINLVELTICGSQCRSMMYDLYKIRFVLDEELFLKIVDIVKGRPKLLTLKCKSNFILKNFDGNRKIRLLPPDKLIDW